MLFPVADAKAAGEETTTTMARARFKEGVEFYDKGEYELARAAFLEAYALKKHPAVLLNLAWSCLKSGHVRESEQYFRQFLSEGQEITERQRADANDGLNQAHSKLGRIEVSAPAGTDVTIDGEHVSTPPPEAAYVDPGFHTVVFRAPDGTVDTKGVTVAAGEVAVARFVRPAQAPVSGTPPPAAQEEPAPTTSPPAPANGTASPAKAEPEAAKPAPVEPRAEKPEGGGNQVSTGLIVAGGIVALAGAGTAIGMLIAKDMSKNNADSTGSQIVAYSAAHGIDANNCASPAPAAIASACGVWNSDNKIVNTDALIGNIALGVGIAAAAGTAVYWIIAAARSDAPPSAGTTIVPMLDRSTAGLSLSSRF